MFHASDRRSETDLIRPYISAGRRLLALLLLSAACCCNALKAGPHHRKANIQHKNAHKKK